MSTILLIPGMWSHPGAVKPLQDALTQKGHEVIVVTLPGGRDAEKSLDPAELDRSSWADSVAAVHRALDQLKPGTLPLLIGESTSGLIVQMVASQRGTGPLVLLNSPAPGGMQRCLPFLLVSFLKQAFGHSFRRAFWEMNFPACRSENTGIDSSKITVPVLIVSGAKDRIIPRPVSLRLFQLYPQADYQRFAVSGHWICQGEGSERIFGDIGDWIEALEDSDSPVAFPATKEDDTARRGLHHQAPSLPALPPVVIPAAKGARPLSRFAGPRKFQKDVRSVVD